MTTGSCARSPPRTSSNRRRRATTRHCAPRSSSTGGRLRRAAGAHRDVPGRGRLVGGARSVGSRSTCGDHAATVGEAMPSPARIGRSRRRQRAPWPTITLALVPARAATLARRPSLAPSSRISSTRSSPVCRGWCTDVRRVILHEFGPYSNLVVEECDDPVAASDQVVVAIEAGGIGYVDTLCVHGTYQALPAPAVGPGLRAGRHCRRDRRRRDPVRGRRPRARHVVRRQLPDARGAARGRARSGAREPDGRAGGRSGRVVRHHVVCVHAAA